MENKYINGKKCAIFIVMTNYQLMYSIILSHFLSQEGYETILISASTSKKINYLSRNCSDFNRKYIFTHYENQKSYNINLFLKEIFFSKEIKLITKENIKLIFIFNDNIFLQKNIVIYLRKKHSIKVILLEEGLSIYKDSPLVRKHENILKRTIKRLPVIREIFKEIGCSNYIDGIASFSPEKLPYIKRKKVVYQLPKKLPTLSITNKVIETFISHQEKELISLNFKDDYFLYLGQPLSELKILEKNTENSYLKKLDELFTKEKIKLVTKLHPQEDPLKYKSYRSFENIISGEIPAEILSMIIRPKIVISPYSSGASNIERWLEIEAIYLYKLLGLKINIINSKNTPESFDKLSEMLLNAIKKLVDSKHSDNSQYLSFLQRIESTTN